MTFKNHLIRTLLMLGPVLLCTANASAQIVPPRSVEADVVAKQAESLAKPQPQLSIGAPPTASIEVPPDAQKVRFILNGLEIEGNTAYSDEELAQYYEGMIGKEVTLADMYVVAARITQRYLADGYVISKAFLPPQKIADGKVTIRVIEGRIRSVRWEGETIDSPIIGDVTHTLTSMRPLNGKKLEATLLQLNELPGVMAQATLAPGAVEGEVDVVIKVERKRVSASADINSYASRYLGVWQATMQGDLNGVLTDVDKISLGYATSLESDFTRYYRGEYSIVLNDLGTALKFGGSYSRSAPGFTLEPLDITSRARTFWVGVNQPIIRSREENLTLVGQFNMNGQTTDIFDERFYDDRIRSLQLSAQYNRADGWSGMNIVDLSLFKGVDWLNATKTGSPDLSRPLGHSDFFKITLNASRLHTFDPNFSLLTAFSGQHSNTPLLSPEQFGYGGNVFGRAYDSSEISGDDGIAASLELRYSTVITDGLAIQPYIFYDIGKTWDDSQNTNISGASAGIGSRFQLLEHFQLDVNLAKPLTLDPSTPKLGAEKDESRVNASIRITY